MHLCFTNLVKLGQVQGFTDAALVENYLETHQQHFFDELYLRYANKVFYKSFSILNDHVLAEDATQDIFIKILLNLSKFTGKSSFSTWIYSITYNYCIDEIRRMKKEKNTIVSDDGNLLDQEDDGDTLINEANMDALKATLDVIDETDKILLLMKYKDNMLLKDIAETLSLTESAVKMRLQRAKAKFRKGYLSIRNY